MAISGRDRCGPQSECGQPSTRLHTRKTADVDGFCGPSSTLLLKPAEFLRVDVWTVWTPYKGGPAASTCRPAVLPWEAVR